METGIEKLVEGSLPPQEEVVTEVTPEVVTEEVKEVEVQTEEPVEVVATPEVVEEVTEDGPTLAEHIYEQESKEIKDAKQKEYEEEVAKFTIPDPKVEEVKTESKEVVVDEKFEQVAVEQEIKEVVEEISKEPDLNKQTKQWEALLLSLREDNLAAERTVKEKDIEIKTINKKYEEVLEQLQELKYASKNKLDDEIGYFDYLNSKFKKDPANKEVQKQLALFHSKAIAGIYPEFDIQDTFNQISSKQQAAIAAISSGSENPLGKPKKKEDVNPKIALAARGVAKK